MFKFAIKNLLIKKLNVILIIVSIMLSAGTALLAFNTSEQVSDGLDNTSSTYGMIIGPAGSATQLVMNSLFFSDKPTGTFSYEEILNKLRNDDNIGLVKELDENGDPVKDEDGNTVYVLDENGAPLKFIIPFAMADKYNGYNCVGTNTLFLKGKKLQSGKLFDDNGSMEAVVGYEVARANGLKVGDTITTGHALVVHDATPLTVVGILSQTHTSYDTIVFTQLQTIWDLHEAEEESGAEGDDDGTHTHEGEVCAVIVQLKSNDVLQTEINKYDGMTFTYENHHHEEEETPGEGTGSEGTGSEGGHHHAGEDDDEDEEKVVTLQAVIPAQIVRNVMNDADSTKYIVYVLCGIILVMNILVICIITLLNMNYSAKEIRLMRLIGVSMKKISLLYVIENGIIGLCATVFAFFLSKLCSGLVSGYVADMGVVLDRFKVYPMEFAILAGVLVVTILPTVICTKIIGEKDAA